MTYDKKIQLFSLKRIYLCQLLFKRLISMNHYVYHNNNYMYNLHCKRFFLHVIIVNGKLLIGINKTFMSYCCFLKRLRPLRGNTKVLA